MLTAHNGKVIIMTNMKGGIGKTTDNDLLSIVGSQLFHKKILLVDYDQQRNTTSNITSTFQITNYNNSLSYAIENHNWLGSITKLSDNLDFIAGSFSSKGLVDWLNEQFPQGQKRDFAFKDTFDELRNVYDYIFIDCPPSADNLVQSFITTCDYIVQLQELKRFAMEGTQTFTDEVLLKLIAAYQDKVHFQIIGILPVLFSSRMNRQKEHLRILKDRYGESNIFATIIKGSDRLEIYGEDGIRLKDYFDRRIWGIFADIFCELEQRIQYYERTGDTEGFSYTPQFADSIKNKILAKGREIKINGVVTTSGSIK